LTPACPPAVAYSAGLSEQYVSSDIGVKLASHPIRNGSHRSLVGCLSVTLKTPSMSFFARWAPLKRMVQMKM